MGQEVHQPRLWGFRRGRFEIEPQRALGDAVTAREAKDDGPKQVEKNHQVHHFIPLGERPHSRRCVLEIHDLRGRHSSDDALCLIISVRLRTMP